MKTLKLFSLVVLFVVSFCPSSLFAIKRPILKFNTGADVLNKDWKKDYGLDVSSLFRDKENKDMKSVQIEIDCSNKKQYSEYCELKIVLEPLGSDYKLNFNFKSLGIIYINNNVWNFGMEEKNGANVGNIQVEIDVKNSLVTIESLYGYPSSFFLKHTRMSSY